MSPSEIAPTQDDDAEDARRQRAADLFDLRRIIGGLFVIYGVILTITGLLDSHADVTRAAGLRINLLAGLAMLVFGLVFIAWALLRPLSAQLERAEAEAERAERS